MTEALDPQLVREAAEYLSREWADALGRPDRYLFDASERVRLAHIAVVGLRRYADLLERPEQQSDRYSGGFPITLETMVAHARAHGQLDRLRELLDEGDT